MRETGVQMDERIGRWGKWLLRLRLKPSTVGITRPAASVNEGV
jgi:hypothetical protein